MKLLWPGMAHHPATVRFREGGIEVRDGCGEVLMKAVPNRQGRLEVVNCVSGEKMEGREFGKFLKDNVVMYFMGQYMYVNMIWR